MRRGRFQEWRKGGKRTRWKDKKFARLSGRASSRHEWAPHQGSRFKPSERSSSVDFGSRRGKSCSKKYTTTTIFIDNIHRGVSEYQLGRIVKRFAHWSRIYICRKKRSWNRNACAFVDVNDVKDAKRVIEGIKGWTINGNSLWARMEFQGHKVKERRDVPISKSSQPKKSRSWVHKAHSNVNTRLSIKVKADEGMKACLSKCLVTTFSEDKNSKEAMDYLLSRWHNITGLLAFSRKKFLMLFNSTHEAKEVVNMAKSLGEESRRINVRHWAWDDQVEKRRTWVVLRGIPLLAWNKVNVRKIAQTVGAVIKIEEKENQFVENAEIRVHIETTTLHMINWKISVNVEGHDFPVSIVEVGDTRAIHISTDPNESIVQMPQADGAQISGQRIKKVDHLHNDTGGDSICQETSLDNVTVDKGCGDQGRDSDGLSLVEAAHQSHDDQEE